MTALPSEHRALRPLHGHLAILGPEEDLFDTVGELDAIVCPVNLRGSAGGGFIRALGRHFPQELKHYQEAARAGRMMPGKLLVVRAVAQETDILFLPTMPTWRAPAELDWIRRGLDAVVEEVLRRGLGVLAMPAIGCGNGGLPWPTVLDLIRAAAGRMKQTRVLVFEPRLSFKPS